MVFDGLSEKPGVTQRMRERYATKIRAVRATAPADIDVLVLESWLHKANSLKCAMRRLATSRYVFVMEDDTIIHGQVDMSALYGLFTRDAGAVEYVRLNMVEDCFFLKPTDKCKQLGCVPLLSEIVGGSSEIVDGRSEIIDESTRIANSVRRCPRNCFSSELHTPVSARGETLAEIGHA